MTRRYFAALAALFVAAGSAGTIAAVKAAASLKEGTADLKANKIKSIVRREAGAQDAIPKVEARAAQLQSDPSTAAYGARLAQELVNIEMTGAGEMEGRLKDDVALLQAAAGNFQPPSAADLAPLQERYKKFVSDLDDSIFVKDYERLLKKHDKFVRYTSLGLWDKDKIASELQKMEEMAASAPDIAYGRAEGLRGLQNRKLASVKNLVYVGTYPHEEAFLSKDRRSVAVVEEGLGGTVPIETADLVMQNPDGTMCEMNTCNNPAYGMPFSPPLALWMKARMLEGRVPAITFELPDSETAARFAANNPGAKVDGDSNKLIGVQDVLDGKLDDYFKKNVGIVSDTKEAAIVGFFNDFDRDIAENAFGADGRTPFYMFDPKLAKGSPEEVRTEFLKRTEKGTYANAKSLWPELSNHYGDPNVPDGPERVRDAWKHIKQIIGTTPNLAYYSTAGAYHGSKIAFKTLSLASAGTQAWNKLEYYWPGDGTLDWVGVQATGPDPSVEPKGPNVVDSIDQFFSEARSSAWQNTPVMLRGISPGPTPTPENESAWIATVFSKLIKGTCGPNTTIVLVDVPQKLTLWTPDGATAYRTNVTSDKFYKWPLRFKMLEEKK